MDFAEEKTPSGYTLKILFKKMKFLVFNSRGESFSADKEGRSLLHKLPNAVFLGNIFLIERDYLKEYSLLKVRDDTIILPYRNITEKKRKFLFIHYVTSVDVIPMKIVMVKSYSLMLKDIPSDTDIDYLIVDESLSETEVSVIASRYRPGEIIKVTTDKSEVQKGTAEEKGSDYISINTMSDNPVFLASYHLKNMALSNLNQLLLDFDISAFDTQFIIYFINDILENKKDDPDVIRNRSMLTDLKNAYEFYLALIIRDNSFLNEKIESETDFRKLSPYKTLVSKVRSTNPGRDDQLLYTEYENLILEKEESLKVSR
ncbi:MAG: hypothetical protein CVV49_08035 [Spirochaetae bacterium HGW-Spirochaetae-5]|nr:MAG: hypothetical protein CVV49_08035 [Spirochaetae bacterium HGW-Spirochaetae-5]